MFRQVSGSHEHGWSIGNRHFFVVCDTIAEHNKAQLIGQALLPQTQTIWGMLPTMAPPDMTRRNRSLLDHVSMKKVSHG